MFFNRDKHKLPPNKCLRRPFYSIFLFYYNGKNERKRGESF